VTVPSDEDLTPPPPVGDRDVVMSMASETSLAAGAASVEDVMDLVACWYLDFPGIGTIDLEAPKLPSNDRMMLEVVMERMFADPSILETIASVASGLRQYESAGSSAPPPHRMRQREFSRSPRSALSRPRLRPRHRRPKRTRARPCHSPQKQSHPRLLLRWLMRQRVLSERQGLRRPVRSPPPQKRFSCRASPPRPLQSTSPPRP
jgi:hypothetical protein